MKFLKKTLVAFLAGLAVQTANAASDLFGRLAMEGVDIIGSVSYLKMNAYDAGPAGYYRFSYDNRYQAQTTSPIKEVMAAGGSTYHDGKIYACEYDNNFRIDLQKPHWVIYDAKTFEKLTDIKMADNYASTLWCITYDPTTDKIYGIKQMSAMDYCFVEIDPATGTQKQIGGVLNNQYRYKTMGCDKKGQLYVIYMESLNDDESTDVWYLDKVRKSDGKMVRVNTIDVTNLFDGDYYINDTRRQSLFCNFQTGKMYWIYPSSSGYLNLETTNIVELNTTTAVGTLKAYLSKTVLTTGAFFVEPADKAPGVISDFKYEPTEDGSLTAILTFKVPTEAYDGTPLSGKQKVTVKEGNKTLISEEVNPGEEFASEDLTFTNDNHEVTITVSNAAGEGPTVKRSFFAGFDMPKPCTNIKFTADGLNATVTWDAPTTGVNGAPVEADKLRYKLIRYNTPAPQVVAENLTECKFEETLSSEMTRYVYGVVPSVGQADGKMAYSNNLIVGTPLDVPYGGLFNEPEDMINYYTIIDANNDANKNGTGDGTWGYKKPSAMYIFSPQNDADDWLISPPINYKKGHTYTLSFKAHSSMDEYLEAMEVTFGADRTPATQSENVLWSNTEIPMKPSEDSDNEYNVELTVPEDGVYYYGFHCITPAYHGFLFLTDINVKEKTDVSGISSNFADNAGVEYITNLSGQRINGMQKGVNIVKMSNGNTMKVIKK